MCYLNDYLNVLKYDYLNSTLPWAAEEEDKRARERARMKAYQDRIYQENLDDIARKTQNKLQSFAEDKYVSYVCVCVCVHMWF